MPNRILKVAIHDLIRSEGVLEARMGRPDLAVTAPVQRVIDELHDLYSRRGSKTHGRFSTDEDD